MHTFPALTTSHLPMEFSVEPAPPYRPDLRVSHVFGRAWELYRANLGLVVGTSFVFILLALILSGGDTWGLTPAVGNILWLVVAGPLTVGLYSVLLRVVRGEEVRIASLFDGFQHFGRAFGVYVLNLVVVLVGFLLLIIPGIIMSVGLFPAMFLVWDERRPVVETLQRAWDLTRGHKFELFILGIVASIVAILGVVLLVVGFFFTAAFALLAGAVAYEELSLAAA